MNAMLGLTKCAASFCIAKKFFRSRGMARLIFLVDFLAYRCTYYLGYIKTLWL
jgi:hypothetical protein